MKIHSAVLAAVVTLTVCLASTAVAQNGTLQNNMFSQYTTHPGASQATAGMYPAPYSVPRNVGQTYYTYQALMPHEMMYQHQRNYYNYYAGPESFYKNCCNNDGGGGAMTKTTVKWQGGCHHMGPFPWQTHKLQNMHYKIASRHYCLGGKCSPRSGKVRGGCGTGDCGCGN